MSRKVGHNSGGYRYHCEARDGLCYQTTGKPAVPVIICCQGLGTTWHAPHLDIILQHKNGWPSPLQRLQHGRYKMNDCACVRVCVCAQDSWNWPLQEISAISLFIGRSRQLSSWSRVLQACPLPGLHLPIRTATKATVAPHTGRPANRPADDLPHSETNHPS